MSFAFHVASEKFASQVTVRNTSMQYATIFAANAHGNASFSCFHEAEGAEICAIGTREGQVILCSRNVRQFLFREPRDAPVHRVRLNYHGTRCAVFFGDRGMVIDIRHGNTLCAFDAVGPVGFASVTDENLFFTSPARTHLRCVHLRTGTVTPVRAPYEHVCFDDEIAVVSYGTNVRMYDDLRTQTSPNIDIDLGSAPNLDLKIAPGRQPLVWALGSDGLACVNFGTRNVARLTQSFADGSKIVSDGDRCVVYRIQGDGNFEAQSFHLSPDGRDVSATSQRYSIQCEHMANHTEEVFASEGLAPYIQGALLHAQWLPMLLQGVPDESDADDEPEDSDADDEPEDSDAVDEPEGSDEDAATGQQAVINAVRACIQNVDAWANTSLWSSDEYARLRACARTCFTGRRSRIVAAVDSGTTSTDEAIADVQTAVEQIRAARKKIADFFGCAESMGMMDEPDEPEGSDGSEASPDVELSAADAKTQVQRTAFTAHCLEGPLVVDPALHLRVIEALVRYIPHTDVIHTVNTGVIATLNVCLAQFQDVLVDLRRHRARLQCLQDILEERKRSPKRSRH